MNKPAKFHLIVITPIFIILSHYLAIIPHEYAHSIMAWLLGYKAHPFDVNYGGTTWDNLLLLTRIDENVNYETIYAAGHGMHVALIAFAGSGIANLCLFIISLFLLKNHSVKERPYLYYLIFWFNLMNLGNLYDYVPIRTFSPLGDIAAIATGLNISPWWIYVVLGYPIAFLIWHFFTSTMIAAFVNWKINSTAMRAALMITCVFVLFGYYSGMVNLLISANIMQYGEISFFLSLTSCLLIPGIIIIAWPTRRWVNHQLVEIHNRIIRCKAANLKTQQPS